MKKITTLILILISAIGVSAQTKIVVTSEPTDIKYQIAKERVERMAKDIRAQIANQFIAGNSVYEHETQSFLSGMDSLLLVFRSSIAATDTIEVDTVKLRHEQDSIWLKLSEAESNYVIENSTEYKRLLSRIKELEKLLTHSIILPDYAEWVQPLGAHDAYKKGDTVLFNGKLYESLIDGNVWAPNITGWREKTK